jgi:hypothetical protein
MTEWRTQPLDELGNMSAEPGSRPWLLYVANEMRKARYDMMYQQKRLRDFTKSFAKHNGWQEFGYPTWDEYLFERYRTTPDDWGADIDGGAA